MIQRKLILIIICLTLTSINCAYSQSTKPAVLTFDDLQRFDQGKETFRIEGYVLDIYKCPPCPTGAMCKPCIPDNITLVDRAERQDVSSLRRLRVYTDKTDSFKRDGKILLTVRVKSGKAGQPIDAVDLVSLDVFYSETIAGNWEGESICTIKSSPCHDEHVIYHLTEPDAKGALKIQADKVVNGIPDDMGTLDCAFDKAASVIKCQMDHGLWEFKITGDQMKGILTLPDGRLFRNISATKTAK